MCECVWGGSNQKKNKQANEGYSINKGNILQKQNYFVFHKHEHSKEPVPIFGGARGVMVIVSGKGHGDTSSNPGRD